MCQYNTSIYPLYAFVTILIVFIICSCVDALRISVFEKYMHNKLRVITDHCKGVIYKK